MRGLVARSRSAGPRAGHFLGHVQDQLPISFLCFGQQTPELAEIASIFASTTPSYVVRGLPLWEIPELWRLVAVVENLVHRDFQRTRHLFYRFDGRDRMAVLNARDVAAKQSCPLLDIALRELLCFAQRSQPIRDNHVQLPPSPIHRRPPGTLGL